MVSEDYCISLYKKYGSVTKIADDLGIDIQEREFSQKTLKSRIMINCYGDTTIFIRPDIDEYHYNFLLAHELGHYVLHYDTDISFNYYCRVYKTKLEKEANDFACRLLLSDINMDDICSLEFINKEKGIPDKIWYSYIETIKMNS